MNKNRKLMVILAVLILSAALLTGCSDGTQGESGLEGENNISGTSADEGQTAGGGEDVVPTGEGTTAGSQEGSGQTFASADGTLKAFDAKTGLITLTAQSGEELELKLTDGSKILISTTPATLAELANIIGSEASVEYDAEAKTVIEIDIKG